MANPFVLQITFQCELVYFAEVDRTNRSSRPLLSESKKDGAVV